MRLGEDQEAGCRAGEGAGVERRGRDGEREKRKCGPGMGKTENGRGVHDGEEQGWGGRLKVERKRKRVAGEKDGEDIDTGREKNQEEEERGLEQEEEEEVRRQEEKKEKEVRRREEESQEVRKRR